MTFMAKGALDLEDPRCLFTIGMGQRDFPMSVVDAADLIITMGYDMVDRQINGIQQATRKSFT